MTQELLTAIWQEDVVKVKRLLENGTDPNDGKNMYGLSYLEAAKECREASWEFGKSHERKLYLRQRYNPIIKLLKRFGGKEWPH